MSAVPIGFEAIRNSSRQKIGAILTGGLLFLSTIGFVDNWVLLGLLVMTPAIVGRMDRFYPNSDEKWLICFAALAVFDITVSLIIQGEFDTAIASYSVVLIPCFALLSRNLDERVWRTFLLLTVFEVIVGILEYSVGVTSFFKIENAGFFEDDSLYQQRVFGISMNSSALADKLFISTMYAALCWKSLGRVWKIICLVLLPAGFFVTFNRTAMGSTALLMVILLAVQFKNRPKAEGVVIATACLIAVLYIFGAFSADITDTLYRGGENPLANEEKRLFYWQQVYNFIIENPFFGNGSMKYGVYSPDFPTPVHAHNSFLMLVATHGIVLSLFYFTYIFWRRRASVLIYVIPMFVFSMTQYFLFWNVSVSDMFFFWVLSRFRIRQ